MNRALLVVVWVIIAFKPAAAARRCNTPVIGSPFIEWKIGKSRGSLLGGPEVSGSFRQVTAVVILGRISTAKYFLTKKKIAKMTWSYVQSPMPKCFLPSYAVLIIFLFLVVK